MADPILRGAAPPVIATEAATNGNPEPFGTPMEEMLQEAFAKARPDEHKPIVKPKTSAIAEKPVGDAAADPELGPEKTSVDAAKPAMAPESKPPAKAAQWKEVNEERARLKAENEALKAEKDKWKQWETQSKEYDTVKRHNAELLERMQTIAVEKDPRFESYFKQKTDTAIALAKQAVGDSHSERVSKLLQLPDSDWRTEQLETVMSELGPTRQSRLGAAIVEMDRINLERSTAISKSKENWEAMQKADRDRVQGQKQEFERTFQDTLQKWSDPKKGLALFQNKDGDEAHNAEVAQRVETARNILNLNLSADQLSKAALWSAAAPGLLKNQMALAQENKALKAELESLKAGGPELKGGTEGESSTDDEKQYEGMSMGEIIASKARKAGAWQ
jgi:hypothetical protein